MHNDEPGDSALFEELATYAARNAPQARAALQADHDHLPSESVRQAIYKGHQITIRTTYSIEVDGVAIQGHMGVTNDGRVHYHAVPNVSFASAIDMVKQLIDAFPDDFGPRDVDPGNHHLGEEE